MISILGSWIPAICKESIGTSGPSSSPQLSSLEATRCLTATRKRHSHLKHCWIKLLPLKPSTSWGFWAISAGLQSIKSVWLGNQTSLGFSPSSPSTMKEGPVEKVIKTGRWKNPLHLAFLFATYARWSWYLLVPVSVLWNTSEKIWYDASSTLVFHSHTWQNCHTS